MYPSLPDILINRKLITLGCAESVLVDLAILFGRAGVVADENKSTSTSDQHVSELCELLRRSPELMVFALSEFASFGAAPPDGFGQLADWFLHHGHRRMTGAVHQWKSVPEYELAAQSELYKRAYADFRIAKSNKAFRKSLVNIVTTLTGRRQKPVRKCIKAIAGSSLTMEKLDALIADNSCTTNGHTGTDLHQLFELAVSAAGHQQDFNRRLLEEKLKSMKQLADASHEINNPLANIATRAQSLLKEESSPARRRKLSVIYHQAMRAHEMISDLMLFAHPPTASPQSCDLYTLAREVVADMRPSMRDTGVQVRVNLYPETGHAVVDPTQFSVALAALIKNSLEAHESAEGETPVAGSSCTTNRSTSATALGISADTGQFEKTTSTIEVSVWNQTAGCVAVSVTDNGPGPSTDALRHMFDPFYSGREAGRGLGFGLSKAWRICEINGGQLEFDASWPDGARFVMTFPAVRTSSGRIDNSAAA